MKKTKFQKKLLQIFFNFYLRHKIRLGVHFWHFQSDLRPLNMRNRLLQVKFGDDRLNSRWNLEQLEIGNIEPELVQNAPEHHGNVCKTSIKHFYLSYHRTSQFVVHIRPNVDFSKTRTFSIHFLIDKFQNGSYFGGSFFKTTRPISEKIVFCVGNIHTFRMHLKWMDSIE